MFHRRAQRTCHSPEEISTVLLRALAPIRNLEVTLLCSPGLSHNRVGLSGGMGTMGHRNNKGQVVVLQPKNLGDCNYSKDRRARMEG